MRRRARGARWAARGWAGLERSFVWRACTPFPYSPSVAQVTCCTVPKWGAGGATWSWYLESLCFSSTMRQPGGLIFPPGLIWKCIASQWIGPVQTGCNGLDACGYEFLGVFAIGPGDVSVPAGSWCEDHQEVPQYWTGTADSTYTFGVPGLCMGAT